MKKSHTWVRVAQQPAPFYTSCSFASQTSFPIKSLLCGERVSRNVTGKSIRHLTPWSFCLNPQSKEKVSWVGSRVQALDSIPQRACIHIVNNITHISHRRIQPCTFLSHCLPLKLALHYHWFRSRQFCCCWVERVIVSTRCDAWCQRS